MIYTDYALELVREERHRQELKWGEQNHPDSVGADGMSACFSHHIATPKEAKSLCDYRASHGTVTYADILIEEVSEAIWEAGEKDQQKLEAELIQVAAVAVAWIEKIWRDRIHKAGDGKTAAPDHSSSPNTGQ